MLSSRPPRPQPLIELSLGGSVPKGERERIQRLGTTVPVAAGTLLIREGQQGRQFLIVVDGRCAVRSGGDRLASLNPGELVGELALLTRSPCRADVIATKDGAVHALSRREFATLLDTCPRLGRRILDTAIVRLQQRTDRREESVDADPIDEDQTRPQMRSGSTATRSLPPGLGVSARALARTS